MFSRFFPTGAAPAATSTPIPLPSPFPVPPSKAQIHLPADQYLHLGAPTEWWWNTGTLMSGDRVFGFEINVTSHAGEGGGAFTQIMLTDVANNQHYQQTTIYPAGSFDANTWAESDPSKPWYAAMGSPTNPQTYIAMSAPPGDPTQNVAVQALLTDAATGTKVTFDLKLSQSGPPLIVWGTGQFPLKPSGPPLESNNYYYSLTNLVALGSITLAGETFQVTGATWMDHEYGFFQSSGGKPIKWVLQDMQLDNGVSISNFSVTPPVLGKASLGLATVLTPTGLYFVMTSTTPFGKTWTSPESGKSYFMTFGIEIPDFKAVLTVNTLVDSQEFPGTAGSVYEGIAAAWGSFDGKLVTGRAWSEQALA